MEVVWLTVLCGLWSARSRKGPDVLFPQGSPRASPPGQVNPIACHTVNFKPGLCLDHAQRHSAGPPHLLLSSEL